MSIMTLRPGEYALVNVSAPYRALLFPVLELVLITGVCWMGIGWLDVTMADTTYRNGLVVLWCLLALWRFALPVFRARRRRFMVTNTRVIARTGSHVDSIPLHDIVGVRRRRGGISLAIRGYDRPLYFPELPRTRRIEKTLGLALEQLRTPYWG